MSARFPRALLIAGAAIALLGVLVGCDKEIPPAGEVLDGGSIDGAAPASSAGLSPTVMPALVGPMTPLSPPNPLGLPPRRIKLDPGRRVFTVTSEMLARAKLGTTLVFYAATVVGFEGEDLIIEGKGGPSYKVHPGYVIPVPDNPKVRVGQAVLTEYAGAMRHAAVVKIAKGRVHVRYTDMEPRTPEGQLKEKEARFVPQVDGLAPGNFAAAREGEEWRHVLLISPAVEGEKKRWFALGYGSAARLVDEASLQPIPVQFSPKPGAVVWAEWVGSMRKATVQSVDDPGFFTVKFERAGRPATVGWGLIMAPPEE
jgi:hypothetical protein